MKVDSTSETLMLVTDPAALSWVTKDIGRCHSRSTRRWSCITTACVALSLQVGIDLFSLTYLVLQS